MPTTAVEKPAEPNADATERCPVAFRFALDGDLRFLSHHDELRVLARALTRARWPLAYSRGFNPLPRLVLPLPRRVGTASDCEWAVVELCETRPVELLHDSLAAVLPAKCRLRQVVTLPSRAKPHPRRVVFTIDLEPEHATIAESRIADLPAAETLTVDRAYGPGKPTRAIDIRPYIEKVTLDGRTLSMRLAFVDQRTARPSEVLTALTLPASAYDHRWRQVEVEWDIVLAGPSHWPPDTERKYIAHEEDGYTQTKKNDT